MRVCRKFETSNYYLKVIVLLIIDSKAFKYRNSHFESDLKGIEFITFLNII